MHSFWIASAAFALLALFACGESLRDEYPEETTRFADVADSGDSLPYYAGRDMRPTWDLTDEPAVRSLGTFRLIDQTGAEFGSDALAGRIVVASFFFTQCSGVCPITTGNLLNAARQLRETPDVLFLSFSITPDLDTPDVLRAHAAQLGIPAARWRLLTGDRDAIYALARESLSADVISPREGRIARLDANDFLHSENVYLLDGRARVRAIYNGRLPGMVAELLRDTARLRAEQQSLASRSEDR